MSALVGCGAPAATAPAATKASTGEAPPTSERSPEPPDALPNAEARQSDSEAETQGPDSKSEPTTADGEETQTVSGFQLEDGRKPIPSKALPKLGLHHVGMHIGGESNSAESKKPWLSALERQTTAFLNCYRSVREPLTGGTFGADLYVGLEGGAPIVKKTRHKLGGDEFDFCMRDVFSAVRFPRPARATMLSYSLRFEISR